jgi:hypothetical protein
MLVLGLVVVLVVDSCGYAFCRFSSMSLLLMRFSNTWMLDGVACLRRLDFDFWR